MPRQMPRKIPLQLPAVLSLGIITQIGQVVMLRELLMVFHGNELSLGIILAAWMFWVGIGSRLGFRPVETTKNPVRLWTISALALSIVLPLILFLIRILRGFFDIPAGAYLSVSDMGLACFLLLAPVGLLLGFQFVLLSRMWREADHRQDTSGTGKTYIAEALGNLAGGLIFTFIFVHYLNSFQALFLSAVIMLISGLLLNYSHDAGGIKKNMHYGPFLWGMIILLGVLFPVLERVDKAAYARQWHFFSPRYELIETQQSKYGTLYVVKLEDQYSFYQSGHLIFSVAGPEASEPALEEQEGVNFAHFSMVQHQNPQRILLIGGGMRGTLKEIIRYPVEQVDYLELDPVLTETALQYVGPETLEALHGPGVNLTHTDGRLFVKTSSTPSSNSANHLYDMIIVDVPDPATAVLNRYYTKEFFKEARALLAPEGVLVVGAVSTPDLRGRAVANRNAAIYHTLKSVFLQVLPAGERFLFYFASQQPDQVSLDPHVLVDRWKQYQLDEQAFSPLRFYMFLQDPPLSRINWILRNHGRTPGAHLRPPDTGPLTPPSIERQLQEEDSLPAVNEHYFINSDFKPIGYFYSLLFWNTLTRDDHREGFWWILHLEPWWLLLILGFVIVTAFLPRFVKGSAASFGILFAVFTTGLSTMALHMALIFTFQSIYGFIYEMVGLITAIFMAGLGLGAWLSHTFIKDKSNIKILMGFQLLIALLAALIAIVLPKAAAFDTPGLVFILICGLTLGAGLLNGADFPLAAACFLKYSKVKFKSSFISRFLWRLKAESGSKKHNADLNKSYKNDRVIGKESKRPERTAGLVYGIELFGACAGALLAGIVVAPVWGIVACCLLGVFGNGCAFVLLLLTGRAYE